MEHLHTRGKEWGLLALGALCAGFLNGLCGAGGGVVLYFTLGALYGRGAKENLILSSAAVWIFTAISLFFYTPNAHLTLSDVLSVGFPAAAGGLTGAFLLSRIPTNAAKSLFALLLIVSGVFMLTK